MPTNTVILVLEGLSGEQGFVRLPDFVAEIERLQRALRAADVALSGRSTLAYRVVDLSLSSPARVVVGAYPLDAEVDYSRVIGPQLMNTIREIDREEPTGRLEPDLLIALRDLARPVGRSLATARIEISGVEAALTATTAARIDRMLSPEITYSGKIRGMLEYLNIHGHQNVFRIYPDVGPRRIACEFPAELKEDAIKNIGRFVTVHGVIHEKRIAKYPHLVRVFTIEPHLDESEAPTLVDLHGIGAGEIIPPPREEVVRILEDVIG